MFAGAITPSEELARAFVGYARWVVRDASALTFRSYSLVLVVATAGLMLAERARPWNAWSIPSIERARGVFYAFLNFFGFGLLGYAALSDVTARRASHLLAALGVPHLTLAGPLAHPVVSAGLYLVVRDLIEYWIHRLLHRSKTLWRVHALHHSATEMHVLVHLRFHPLETVIYRTLEFVPMTLLGFGAGDFFFAHVVALVVGHLNHANVRVPFGPLRYVFSTAPMHLVHHAKHLPEGADGRARGVNFGLTFIVWDYLFGTAHVPAADAPREPLGFERVAAFPRGLPGELASPFTRAPEPLAGETPSAGAE